MPTELKGAVQLRIALKRFAPDLAKETQVEMATALKTVVNVARGFIPSDTKVLSGWSKKAGDQTNLLYRPFPKFNSAIAKAGVGYTTTPSKPNNNGFVALARIFNKSAGGAIYETAGRKNEHGQPNFVRPNFVYRTSGDAANADFQLNYHVDNTTGYRKGYNNSLNPEAGREFIDNLNASGRLVNARPKGIRGNPGRKMTGRVIFRAWAEDNGRANAAIIKAIEKSSKLFYEATKRAA